MRWRLQASVRSRVERLQFLCERSELALPRLFALGERFDVGLIDG